MAPDGPAALAPTSPRDPDAAVDSDPQRTARTDAARTRHRRRARRTKTLSYAALVLGSLIVLFPLYVFVVDSLLSTSQLVHIPPVFFPTHPQWSNYSNAITQYGFGGYLRNSIIQTSIIVSTQLVTSILAAYAFVFLRFPLRRTLFLIALGTVMIPFEITVAGNYTTITRLGWNSTFLGLTIPFFATGFGIFLLRQAFLSIPKELKEAAVIDGYGPLQFLWRIALPLSRPVVAALAVFSFLGAWNQYLWPALLTGSPQGQSIRTVQIGLAVVGGNVQDVGVQLAGGIISIVPLLILLIFFRKNLIRSLTAGAVR
jgi:sn-glycerol 3-phosphate transport system permease protein